MCTRRGYSQLCLDSLNPIRIIIYPLKGNNVITWRFSIRSVLFVFGTLWSNILKITVGKHIINTSSSLFSVYDTYYRLILIIWTVDLSDSLRRVFETTVGFVLPTNLVSANLALQCLFVFSFVPFLLFYKLNWISYWYRLVVRTISAGWVNNKPK